MKFKLTNIATGKYRLVSKEERDAVINHPSFANSYEFVEYGGSEPEGKPSKAAAEKAAAKAADDKAAAEKAAAEKAAADKK